MFLRSWRSLNIVGHFSMNHVVICFQRTIEKTGDFQFMLLFFFFYRAAFSFIVFMANLRSKTNSHAHMHVAHPSIHHCTTYSSSFHHSFQQPHSIDLFVRHYFISPYHFNSPHLLVLTTSTPTPQPPHHNHHDYHHHFIPSHHHHHRFIPSHHTQLSRTILYFFRATLLHLLESISQAPTERDDGDFSVIWKGE